MDREFRVTMIQHMPTREAKLLEVVNIVEMAAFPATMDLQIRKPVNFDKLEMGRVYLLSEIMELVL